MPSFSPRAGQAMLALTLAALTACADRPDLTGPLEPPVVEEDVPAGKELVPTRQDPASLLGDRAHWADGYLRSFDPLSPSVKPSSAFNRSGGPITITKPAGTTGRYIATFKGLSGFLGSRNTVHVTGHGNGLFSDTWCKPVGASLVNDRIEVRCFKASTGVPANATFSVLITRNYSDLAFAYAHKPTGTGYRPSAAGSWNPAGAITVFRTEPGRYRVVFTNLGAELPANVAGHVQVNAVGTAQVHCKTEGWGGSPDLAISVGCYSPTGALADSKFTVLLLVPTAHLAYAWADSPLAASYSPAPAYSSNRAEGGTIQIERLGVGEYRATWWEADSEIFDHGNVQVTGFGEGYGQCTLASNMYSESVVVRCFAPNGVPMDSQFTVLLGS